MGPAADDDPVDTAAPASAGASDATPPLADDPDPRLPATEPPTDFEPGDAPRPARTALRDGTFTTVTLVTSADEAAGSAEPVVSANANGVDATAPPTPNATANAPTRPTKRP